MSTAAELRKQIESTLAGRIPAALSWRPLRSPELLSCGVAEVDALLGGGLPRGSIVELTGDRSSGRTTLALSTLSELTRQGHCCAYVDACDTLDPFSAAALGVELHRLLWVRPPDSARNRAGAPPSPPSLRLRWEGGTATSKAALSTARLDAALRATDLLLATGGWGALVLDLGELPPELARRVPMTTWYRFRLHAEKSRTLLLLITHGAPCSQSCAAVSLHCHPPIPAWRRAAPLSPPLLAGLHYRFSLERFSLGRSRDATPKKPAASCGKSEAAWHGATSWTG